jgi:hypothetical protein
VTDFKLTCELVPTPCWYSNLRNACPTHVWDAIRKETYQKYGYRCAICGRSHKLHCHEIWSYDDENHVQRLEGFISLCYMCHHVKHLGYAEVLAQRGAIKLDDLINHFCRVNQCDRATFAVYRRLVFLEWNQRSQHKWTTVFDEWEQFFAPSYERTTKQCGLPQSDE